MAYILGKDYGKRVLLCDLDSSGNLSSSLYYQDEERGIVRCKRADPLDTFGVPQILIDKNADIRDNVISTTFENVDLAPSNDAMQSADTSIRLDQTCPQQFRLSLQLKTIRNQYDYIILDCPPAQDMIVVNALFCSQEVIIPSTINQDSLEAIPRVMKLAEEATNYNPALEISGVLFTRVARNTSLDLQGVQDMRAVSAEDGFRVFNTYIRNSVSVERCRFASMSLREYDPKCAPAIDYDNFVAEYLGVKIPHSDVSYD